MEVTLQRFASYTGVELQAEHERTLVTGRADAIFNRLVIEYEPPRSLTPTNNSRANQHAIGQVQSYLTGMEKDDLRSKERLAGVVLDGCYFIFCRYRQRRWVIESPQPVNAHSTADFLRYLISLSTELAVTPENLQRDFGEGSEAARQARARVLPCVAPRRPSQNRDPLSAMAQAVRRDHRLRIRLRPARCGGVGQSLRHPPHPNPSPRGRGAYPRFY